MNTSARYLSNRHRPALKAICTIALAVGMALSGLAASVGEGLPPRGVCAHRGANSTHPENTLAAFLAAKRDIKPLKCLP